MGSKVTTLSGKNTILMCERLMNDELFIKESGLDHVTVHVVWLLYERREDRYAGENEADGRPWGREAE